MLRIKELRITHNLSLKEFGNKFDLAESTISLYESGKRQPDIKTLSKIADYFNVSLDYLLGRGESKLKITLDSEKFKQNNGIILSIIGKNLPLKWLPISELMEIYKKYNLTDCEIKESLFYCYARKYITIRTIEDKQAIDLYDSEYKNIEIIISADGTLILLGLKSDIAIEIKKNR